MAKRKSAHHPKARSGMKKPDRRGAVRSKKEYDEKAEVQVSEEQIAHFANRITTFLRKANGRPVSRADLASKCRGKGQAAYLRALKKLITEGTLAVRRSGHQCAEAASTLRAGISRSNGTRGSPRRQTRASE